MRRPFSAARLVKLMTLVTAAGLTVSLAASPSSSSFAAPSSSKLDQAQDRLSALEREFEVVVERYNATDEKLDALEARIASTRVVLERVGKRIDASESSAVDFARSLYEGGATEAIEVVLSSDNLAEIQSRVQYLSSSQKEQTEVFEQLAADRAVLKESLAALERDRLAAARARDRLVELRSDIQAKIRSQRDEIAHLEAVIERAQRRRAAAARAARAAAQAAAETPATPAPQPQPQPAAPAQAGSRAAAAVSAALSRVGMPYQWGAAGPSSFDCSGLTMWSWAQAGVSLPHSSAAQYAATPRVAQGDWQPGDLLFSGSPIHHVGMYIGGGRMVEAPYTGASVRVVSAYRSDYVGAGRPGV
jgi:peptidoglycan DL-endopeptidase CwlO